MGVVEGARTEVVCQVTDEQGNLVAQAHNTLTNAHRELYALLLSGQSTDRPTTLYAGLGAELSATAYAGSLAVNLNTTVGLEVGANLVLGTGTSLVHQSVITDISGSLVTLADPLPATLSHTGAERSAVVEPNTEATLLQARTGDPVTATAAVYNTFWAAFSGAFVGGNPTIPTGQSDIVMREIGLFDGEFSATNTPRLISRVVVNLTKRPATVYRVEFRSRLVP